MGQIPSVHELIRMRRADATSRPGFRNDPWKLAIVAEDGGQRWVVAGGVGAALEELGILPDLIVGSSGGGLGAMYMATGGVARGCTAYRYVNARGFDNDGKSHRLIDPLRVLKKQPMFDVSGLIHTVFSVRVPVDWDALRHSPIPVFLTAANRITGECVLQPLHGVSVENQKMALVNTARLPLLAHSINDTGVLWDGGMVAPIPLGEALSLGATHFLVIRCKGSDERQLRINKVEKLFLRPILKRKAPDLYELLMRRPTLYQAAHVTVAQYVADGQAIVIQLPDVPIGSGEMREERLFRVMAQAYLHTAPSLGIDDKLPWPDEWEPEVKAYL